MIREFGIKNYKSILDHTIELGRFNVFIGENGCGKTNLLEAVAMAAAASTGKLDVEDLFNRGIRIAKPSTTFSSFFGKRQSKQIEFEYAFGGNSDVQPWKISFSINKPESAGEIDSDWIPNVEQPLLGDNTERARVQRDHLGRQVGAFVIYNLNTLALRGIENPSKRRPLGINGESLDILLSKFEKEAMNEILRRAKNMISWLNDVIVDAGDLLKFGDHKLGRSTSTLYFKDRFMHRRNNIFSAENANEGVLHILFYLALFFSKATPSIFGIDNIESALNPQLCRDLVKELAVLANEHGKQALVTTHNPAILDGLNLHDDEQRLFVVSRNDEGHTVTKRIRMKPQVDGERYKLSELWMRGLLGGLPTRF
jgi:AAA15 family ATPase/GTPase